MKAKKKETVLLLTKEQAATFPQCRGMSDKQLYDKLKEAMKRRKK